MEPARPRVDEAPTLPGLTSRLGPTPLKVTMPQILQSPGKALAEQTWMDGHGMPPIAGSGHSLSLPEGTHCVLLQDYTVWPPSTSGVESAKQLLLGEAEQRLIWGV